MVSVALETWSQLNARIIAAETKTNQTNKINSKTKNSKPSQNKKNNSNDTVLFN